MGERGFFQAKIRKRSERTAPGIHQNFSSSKRGWEKALFPK
jgi:hypothetical protein